MQDHAHPPLNKVNIAVFVGLPLAALVLVPLWGFYHGYAASLWLWALVFLYLNGLSITGGYHRLWAHRAYRAHPALRWFFALWGAGALQSSVLDWASDHRRHHRHVDDNERDPYSAQRGLWFSHMGWMLRQYPSNTGALDNVDDLQRDPIVAWQHRHYVPLTLAMNVALPAALGLFLGELIGAILIVGLLRLVVNHHVTFLINSLAHYWGTQPYTDTNSARDNGFLAFLTYGEGYHNFHHIFQSDYRNGVRWWQWDPTKWMINLCARVGLAGDLKRIPNIRIQRAILDAQFSRARRCLEQGASQAGWLRDTLEREYQLFTDFINRWRALHTERYTHHRAALGDALQEKRAGLQQSWRNAAVRAQFKELEYALKLQRKRLQQLMEQIPLQPDPAL